MAWQDSRLICLPEHEDIMEDDGVHTLLEEPQYNFSAMTRQRALIAWIATGRKNDYQSVCKYYHFLEEHEETLTMEKRLMSRSLEFKALPTCSPQAEILQQVFPNLYTQSRNNSLMDPNSRGITSTDAIIPASIAITNYLKSKGKDMATFLNEFKDYTNATGCASTLNSLLHYIQLKSNDEPFVPFAAVTIAADTVDVVADSFDETLNNSLSELFIRDNDSPNSLKHSKIKSASLNCMTELDLYDDEEKENFDAKKNYADVEKNIATNQSVLDDKNDNQTMTNHVIN